MGGHLKHELTAKMVEEPSPQQSKMEVSHNLFGQRLGRKGQETRERILTTALRLIETQPDTQITLSAVAREASVGMTTLYLYFPDLGDLILAVLIRVMDSAGPEFEDQLRLRWPDDGLREACEDFLLSHYNFWMRHTNILQLRNKYADAGDLRYLRYRNSVSQPAIELFIRQMDSDPEMPNSLSAGVATVLFITLERLASTVTNPTFHWAIKETGVTDQPAFIEMLLKAEAEVMAHAIEHQRAIAGAGKKPAVRRTKAKA